MAKKYGNPTDSEYLRQGGKKNATFQETIPRWAAAADNAIAATGVELSVAIPLTAGDLVTSITFITGGTAGGTLTAGYACLRDGAGALLGQSADFGATARAANTVFTVTLATPVTVPVSGIYYIGISFTASTVPTLRGATVGNAAVSGNLGLAAAVLSRSHGSAVGAVAPAATTSPTTVAVIPYLVAS